MRIPTAKIRLAVNPARKPFAKSRLSITNSLSDQLRDLHFVEVCEGCKRLEGGIVGPASFKGVDLIFGKPSLERDIPSSKASFLAKFF